MHDNRCELLKMIYTPQWNELLLYETLKNK